MRQIWIVIFLAMFLLMGQMTAADQSRKREVAKGKAEVLEEMVSTEGTKAQPTLTEVITKSQVQAVDPKGEEPLDDAITCLARTIYWEARSEDDAEKEKSYSHVKEIARKAINRQLKDRTAGALYFHNEFLKIQYAIL